jgi:hypothetical protein
MQCKYNVNDDLLFKSAKLLKLIEFLSKDIVNKRLCKIDNLLILDFFASHPFCIFNNNDKEYNELLFNGFPKINIEYLHLKELYTKQKDVISKSLDLLFSTKLIDQIKLTDYKIYKITNKGIEMSNRLSTDYYKAYSLSILLVFNKIDSKSSKEIEDLSEIWLNYKPNINGVEYINEF